MGLAFGGKELVFEEDPNLNLRKVHYHLIRDKGLSLVSSCGDIDCPGPHNYGGSRQRRHGVDAAGRIACAAVGIFARL